MKNKYIFILLFFLPSLSYAQELTFAQVQNEFFDVLTVVSAFVGMIAASGGLFKIYKHCEDPQNNDLSSAIAMSLFGLILFSSPSLMSNIFPEIKENTEKTVLIDGSNREFNQNIVLQNQKQNNTTKEKGFESEDDF